MKALKTNEHIDSQDNVKYISSYRQRSNVKPYVKLDLDWQEITRANNLEKFLSEAAVILAGRLAYELFKNNDQAVFLPSYWFEQTTNKKRHQNSRLRGQLNHIFNFRFCSRKFYNGTLLFNVFEVCYTAKSQEIMNLKDTNHGANKQQGGSIYAPPMEHKCSTHIYSNNKYNNINNRSTKSSISKNAFQEKEELVETTEFETPTTELVEIQNGLAVEEKEPVEPPAATTSAESTTNEALIPAEHQKKLEDFYPLSEKDCSELQKGSKREFNLHAMNEILKHKARKLSHLSLPRFKGKDGFISYFTLSLKFEKRQASQINNESFRIRANLTPEELQSAAAERRGERAERKAEEEKERRIMQRVPANQNQVQGFKAAGSIPLGIIDKITGSNTESTTKTKEENEVINSSKPAQSQEIQEREPIKLDPVQTVKPQKVQSKIDALKASTFPDNVWGEIRKEIAKEFFDKYGAEGGKLEKNWFGKVEAEINEETKEITVVAPSEDMKNWIVINYQNKIELTAKDLGYSLQTIKF